MRNRVSAAILYTYIKRRLQYSAMTAISLKNSCFIM